MNLRPACLHFATAAALLTVSGAISPAKADPCDELARSLSQQIDGLRVGRARGGIIYLQHPAASQASATGFTTSGVEVVSIMSMP